VDEIFCLFFFSKSKTRSYKIVEHNTLNEQTQNNKKYKNMQKSRSITEKVSSSTDDDRQAMGDESRYR